MDSGRERAVSLREFGLECGNQINLIDVTLIAATNRVNNLILTVFKRPTGTILLLDIIEKIY